jgi:hypothetical protein
VRFPFESRKDRKLILSTSMRVAAGAAAVLVGYSFCLRALVSKLLRSVLSGHHFVSRANEQIFLLPGPKINITLEFGICATKNATLTN